MIDNSKVTIGAAYGFRIRSFPPATDLLNPAPDDWPELEVTQVVEETTIFANKLDETSAVVGFLTGGGAFMDRTPRRATLHVPELLTHDELAHPYLAPLASAHAHWMGWLPFHAGGIVVGGRVWGIVGEREAGKSTLLAALAIRGVPVVADDLIVVDGDTVYAGPRTLDLRREAADRFGVGRELGVVGLRERWRFDLPPVALEVPLGGWVFPRWDGSISITRTPPAARITRLAPGRTVLNPDIDALALMRLSAMPAFDFMRPPEWDDMDTGLDRLIAVLDQEAR